MVRNNSSLSALLLIYCDILEFIVGLKYDIKTTIHEYFHHYYDSYHCSYSDIYFTDSILIIEHIMCMQFSI